LTRLGGKKDECHAREYGSENHAPDQHPLAASRLATPQLGDGTIELLSGVLTFGGARLDVAGNCPEQVVYWVAFLLSHR